MQRSIIVLTIAVMCSACGILPHRYESVPESVPAPRAERAPRTRGHRTPFTCPVRTSTIAIAAGAVRLPLRDGEAGEVRATLLTFYLSEIAAFARAKQDPTFTAAVAARKVGELSVAVTENGFVVYRDGVRLKKSALTVSSRLRNQRLDPDEAALGNIEQGKAAVIRLPDLGTVGGERIRLVPMRSMCATRRTEAEDDLIRTVLHRLAQKTKL